MVDFTWYGGKGIRVLELADHNFNILFRATVRVNKLMQVNTTKVTSFPSL